MKLTKKGLFLDNIEEYSIIDGNKYIHLLHHDNKSGTVYFKDSDDPNTYVYHSSNCWSKLYLLNTVFKNLSRYEFCVIESNNGSSQIFKFAQNINPFKAKFEDVSHANITPISNISSSYGGMYLRANSNDNSHKDGDELGKYNFFTFNNSNRGNWWGTMTCHIYYGGIPGYNNIINLGSQDIYLKSDMVQILEKNFMFSKEIYEI